MKISFLTASVFAAGLGLGGPAFAQSAAAEGKVVQSPDVAPQSPNGTVQKQRPGTQTSQRHKPATTRHSRHTNPASASPPAATGRTSPSAPGAPSGAAGNTQ